MSPKGRKWFSIKRIVFRFYFTLLILAVDAVTPAYHVHGVVIQQLKLAVQFRYVVACSGSRVEQLVFQPAEETAEGARFMLKTGVLDSVKRIYGVHIFNGIPSGKISLEAGPRMAATNWLAVHLYGKSGHAGKPHEGIDTAVAVSSMVMNMQTIVSRNLNPLDPAVLTIGKVEAGTARNVIAGEAKIEGTARTFSRQAQEMIERRVKEIAKAHEQMYGIDVTVDFQPSSHGALINDPEIVENVMEKAGEVFDSSEFTHVPAMMLGEDFANYLEEIDGCFAFIGGGDHPANHHGKFDFDEKALISGVRLMLTFVIV